MNSFAISEIAAPMRKAVLFILGIASGVVFTIAATQMRMIPVGVDFTPVAIPGSSRPLDRFADAFAQVRERYVEKPGDAQLVDAAVDGMLSSLEDFELPQSRGREPYGELHA